jgi:hypothetical protein
MDSTTSPLTHTKLTQALKGKGRRRQRQEIEERREDLHERSISLRRNDGMNNTRANKPLSIHNTPLKGPPSHG